MTTIPVTPLSNRSHWAANQPISELMAQALANPKLISLAAGFVDNATLPCDIAHEICDEILRESTSARAALQYGSTQGLPPLREAIGQRLRTQDATATPQTSIDQIIVTAGSNQLLHLVADTLIDPGDIVLCAAPSYFVFLGTLAGVGARAISVATDQHGVIPDAVDSAFQRLADGEQLSRVKALYVVSYFDNPCGVTLSEHRRKQLLEVVTRWSKQHKIYLIEDAAYRELRFDGPDEPSIWGMQQHSDQVIHAGTFSKSFAPGLRVGWGILPQELVQPVIDQKGNVDFGSPNLAQHIIRRALESGRFDEHVQRLRTNYQIKRDVMTDALTQHVGQIDGAHWIHPSGGLYVWLTLPESVDTGFEGQLFRAAQEAGVLYVPGIYCYPTQGDRPNNTIRLSFGVQPEDAIVRGIAALSAAIASVL